MSETPRPDPWAQVRTFDVSTYGDCRMERDYYGDITSEQTHQRGEYAWVDEVDAARAADAERHHAEIDALNCVIREHLEFGGLFQPGGRFHEEATVENLLFGQSAVVSGGRWLVEQYDTLTAENVSLRTNNREVKALFDERASEITTLRAQNADYVEQHGKVTRCLAARTVERDALRSTVDQQTQQIADLQSIVRDTLWMAGRYADKRRSYAVGMYNDARVKAEAMGCADDAKVAVDGMDPEFVTLTERAEAAEARCATLTAALEEVTRDMDRAGGDGYGMPECPWCRLSSDDDRVEGYSHDATCELVKARAALAAAPQGGKP